MKQVTKERFFAVIGPMDVTPRPERDHSLWETRARQIVGRTTPGYALRDENGLLTSEKKFFLAERFAGCGKAAGEVAA